MQKTKPNNGIQIKKNILFARFLHIFTIYYNTNGANSHSYLFTDHLLEKKKYLFTTTNIAVEH